MSDRPTALGALPMVVYGRIYRARNTITGKSYIGATRKTVLQRQKEHKKYAKRKCLKVFHAALNKYGFDNFEWTHLDVASSRKELFRLEIFYIAFYRTITPYGYNLTAGGEGLNEPSEELRKKLRKIQNNRSLEWIERMRASGRTKIFTDEHKDNLSRAALNRDLTPELRLIYSEAGANGFLGRNHTDESKEKMSNSHKGKVLTEEHKANIGKAVKGRKVKTSPNRGWAWRGRKHSPETIARIKETKRLRREGLI